MNIRKCYIENFGKLHNFTHEFSEGLNIINEKNGWGKSTFATFIKAMFFGFDNSNKRAISENERKKYYPWQGGKFGGNLEFEINGKIYEIERFFGLKDKEDTFKLYNKITNCESNDFSENIGEEIFKIDRQAYERSTYIPQQGISVEINDSLSAKLSNILEGENDINTSEEAINKITTVMKEYKKIGNKGKINELESKINNKKRELEYAKNNEEVINKRNIKIEKIKSEIKILEENKNKNQEKINQINEQEKNKIKKDRYEEICNILKKDEEELRKIEEYFNGIIPEDGEVKKQQEITYKLDTLIAKLDECVIEDSDREKYENLREQFEENEISEKTIDDNYLNLNKIEDIKKDLIILKERLENQEKIERIKNENNKQKSIKKIIAILIVLLGIILGIFLSKYLFGISIIGIIVLILGLNKKEKEDSQEIKNKILTEINDKNTELITLEKMVENFFEIFGKNSENNQEKIKKIKNNYFLFENLEKIINNKENKRLEIQKEIDGLTEDLYSELINYLNININRNNIDEFNKICKNILTEINNKKREYNNLLLKIENDKKIKQKYEDENKIEEIINGNSDIMDNKEELLKQDEEISKKIRELINQKSYDENEMNRLINTSVTVEEIEAEIENLQQNLGEINAKYNILDKTQKYLIKAKEQFSAHYLKDMTDGFEKYINIINEEKLDTNIDIKLNVRVQEYGEKKEIDYLSAGYKDLIGICMRFALVDALFENEEPFIILDDPFVNLDRDKIEKAKELVKELSKKYQVIYFVCHESRK